MSKKKQDDSWALLASELGLEEESSQEEELNENVSENSFEASDEEKDARVHEFVDSTTSVESSRREEKAEVQDFTNGFGAGILDNAPEQTPDANRSVPPKSLDSPEPKDSLEPKEKKKTFFGRFPKINLFGSSSAKESLEDAVEGTKSSALKGKSFTSKTLEKVPVPSGRSERVEKPEAESARKIGDKVADDTEKPRSDRPAEVPSDPWSQIASQVGVLGGAKPAPASLKTDPKNENTKTQRGRRSRNEEPKADRPDKRRAGKQQSTFFDDAPGENEESLALKNLIDDAETREYDEAARRLSSIFGEGLDESTGESGSGTPREEDRRKGRETRQRGRRESVSRGASNDVPRGPSRSVSRDTSRGVSRGVSHNEDVSSDANDDWNDRTSFDGGRGDFEQRKPASSSEGRVRGRRGSRYVEHGVEHDVEREEAPAVPDYHESDLDAETPAWDIEEESQPVERRPRRQRGARPDERTAESKRRTPARRSFEPEEENDGAGNELDFSRAQADMPSWDDAISVIIEGNVARHGQRSDSRRGRR